MLQNPGEIFLGVTKAPFRAYLREAMGAYKPPRMIHPCVGKFGALAAAVQGGVAPSKHEASDLSLFTTILGTLADPTTSISDLGLRPHADVQKFLADDDFDPADELDYAARILLTIKWCQLEPRNRFVESMRRDLVVRQERHRDVLKAQLEHFLEEVAGVHYRVANLWDVLAELEATPPAQERTTLFLSASWFGGGYEAQMVTAERLWGWPGLFGREFDPDDLPELLGRASVIPNLTTLVYVNEDLAEKVPDSFVPVMAAPAGGGAERLFSTVDLSKYAPQTIKRLNPRPVQILGENDKVTRNSKVEIVPIDSDTALYLRDLFVHRLGRATTDNYFAISIDGKVAGVIGLLLTQILGAGHPTTYINEVFGCARSLDSLPRLARLPHYLLTSGDTRRMLLAHAPGLQGRELHGIQSTETRYYANTKDKIFKPFRIDKTPEGMFKIISRGEFRDDTWTDSFQAWWDRFIEPKNEETSNGRKRRRRGRAQPAETA